MYNNCICTHMHNVPKSLSLSLSLSLAFPGEDTAISSHRRIAGRTVVFAQSFTFPCVCANKMHTCIHDGMYTTARRDPHLRATRRYISYPTWKSLRIACITTTHILQRPSIPDCIILFKRTACRTSSRVNYCEKRKYIFFYRKNILFSQ